MFLSAVNHGKQVVHRVSFSEAVQTGRLLPARAAEADGFSPAAYLAVCILKIFQQLFHRGGLLGQSGIDEEPELLPMRWFLPVSQPLVVAFSVPGGSLHDGQAVLDAERIAELPDRFRASPEVAELAVAVQIHRRPDDVIVDVGLVDVRADDERMTAAGKPFGKFFTDPVGLFRCDFSREKRLPEMIGNHIVRAPHPSRFLNVFPFGHQELGVGAAAVAGIAADKTPVFRFLRVCNIVDNIADCPAEAPALSGVQGHDPRGCQT